MLIMFMTPFGVLYTRSPIRWVTRDQWTLLQAHLNQTPQGDLSKGALNVVSQLSQLGKCKNLWQKVLWHWPLDSKAGTVTTHLKCLKQLKWPQKSITIVSFLREYFLVMFAQQSKSRIVNTNFLDILYAKLSMKCKGGMGLMSWRSWVRIPALFAGWTFCHIYLL